MMFKLDNKPFFPTILPSFTENFIMNFNIDVLQRWINHGQDCKAKRAIKGCFETAERIQNWLLGLTNCPSPVAKLIVSYLTVFEAQLAVQVGKWVHVHYGGQPRITVPFQVIDATNDRWTIPLKPLLSCYRYCGLREAFERVGIRFRIRTISNHWTGWLLIFTIHHAVQGLDTNKCSDGVSSTMPQAMCPDRTSFIVNCLWNDNKISHITLNLNHLT
jgi:hypothetical protein